MRNKILNLKDELNNYSYSELNGDVSNIADNTVLRDLLSLNMLLTTLQFSKNELRIIVIYLLQTF